MKTRSALQALAGWVTPFLVCTGLLFSSFSTTAQPTGTQTVGAGSDYTTFTATIADLDLPGVGGGGMTFNVLAGHRVIYKKR